MASVLAFLQARMGSSRLPGKVMLQIGGRTLLARAIERLQATRTLERVVVVTTEKDEDDEVVVEAQRHGAAIFRGSDVDVLKRFHDAAQAFRPEIVLRATADNPLIDLGSVERIVRALRWSGLDYCMESDLPVGAATEAITTRALARVHREAKEPRHREHVTLYVKERPSEFRMALLAPPDSLRRPDIRITVDTPQDFLFVEELILAVPEEDRPVPLARYLDLADTVARARV